MICFTIFCSACGYPTHYGEKEGLPAYNTHFSGNEQVTFMRSLRLSLKFCNPSSCNS